MVFFLQWNTKTETKLCFLFFFPYKWNSDREIEIFCNINIFPVTFDQFTESLLNKTVVMCTAATTALIIVYMYYYILFIY